MTTALTAALFAIAALAFAVGAATLSRLWTVVSAELAEIEDRLIELADDVDDLLAESSTMIDLDDPEEASHDDPDWWKNA